MYRKIALLLLVSCASAAGATCIAGAQRSSVQAEDTTSPTRQRVGPAQDEKGKGSISGRVANEDATPAVGRVVFVYYGRRGAHPNMPVQTGLILTDKNGRFHVADLFAGEYIISVVQPCCQEPNEDSISRDEAKDAPYYKTELTYYKDTLDRKDATPVWVKANVETLSVDITLHRRWLHKVSGTVFNRNGQPLPGAKVMVTRKQKPDTGPHSSGVSTVADRQGNWSLEVADGVYLIKAFNVIATFESGETVSGYQDPPTGSRAPAPRQGLPGMPSTKSVFNDPAQPRQVSVSGSDVPDVMIDMNHRAQIVSGRIVLENGGTIPPEVTIDVDINSDYNSNRIRLDGSFERKGPLLGERFLSIIIQPYGTYYIKSMTCDGTDYLREPFEFGNGVDYKGVEVVLSPRGTLLEGRVRLNGTTSPVTSGQVWLVPEDETKWRAPLTWSSSRIYEGGVYTMYAAPGDYLIIVDEGAGHSFDPFDHLDRTEDFVRKHAPGARHITLKAGEGRSVELSKRL